MILTSMKIVKDHRGRYALRKRFLFAYYYKDLRDEDDFWWGLDRMRYLDNDILDNDIWSRNFEKVYAEYRYQRQKTAFGYMKKLYAALKMRLQPQGTVIPTKDLDLEIVQRRLQGE